MTQGPSETELLAAQRCLNFFASVIKSGESWSATCEAEFRAAKEALSTRPTSALPDERAKLLADASDLKAKLQRAEDGGYTWDRTKAMCGEAAQTISRLTTALSTTIAPVPDERQEEAWFPAHAVGRLLLNHNEEEDGEPVLVDRDDLGTVLAWIESTSRRAAPLPDKEAVERLKRRIAGVRNWMGITMLQARLRDRDGDYSPSDVFNDLEARLTSISSTEGGLREREAVVCWLREQADEGAEWGIAAEKGTTRRAAYGGGSLALDRAADAIEQGKHLGSLPPVVAPLEREQGPPCENCGRPVEPGQVVLPWEEPGEMHADCDHPYSLEVERGEDEPEPVVLLGEPMIHFPLADIAALASSPPNGETEGERDA